MGLISMHRDGGMVGGSAAAPPASNPSQQSFNSPLPGAAIPREYSGGPINSAFVPSANGNSMAIG